MKNKFSVLFLFMALISLLSIFSKFTKKVYAEENEQINITSNSAYLVHPDSGEVIYKKNENLRLPIASMCKIMTLLIAFDEIDNGNLSLDEKICISQNAMNMGGSQVFLESNSEYLASELIKSIVVASANDSSVAIAERISGNEDLFVELMNQKACELNMENTKFVNCTGLPKNGQYSSAKDVAIMFSNLIKHKEFFTFSNIWMDEIIHPNNRKTEISNTNKLIKFYNGCDSGKTGYTSEAGHCLCASAIRNGLRFISVIIKAPDSKTRFKEASELFNYGFANYINKKVLEKDKPLEFKINVSQSKTKDITISSEEDLQVLSKKGEQRAFSFNFISDNNLKAPLNKGDIVGKLTVFEKGIELKTVNVKLLCDVEKKSYIDNLSEIICNWGIS